MRVRAWCLRLGLAALNLLGAVLVAVSAVALIPTAWIAVLKILEFMPGGTKGGAFTDFPAVVRDHPLLIWLTSLLVAVGGRQLGLWILRRRRHLVIFLRRFRFSPATDAVKQAAAGIGGSWRFVTLDDDTHVEPIGVSQVATAAVRGDDQISRFVQGFMPRAGEVALKAVVTISAVTLGVPSLLVFLTGTGTAEQRRDLVVDVLTGVRPAVGLAQAALHLGVLVTAFCLAAGMLYAFVGLALIVLLPVLALFSTLGTGVRRAEENKSVTISKAGSIRPTRKVLRRVMRRVFSARLSILKVDGSIWRPTVREIASDCQVSLIDISLLDISLPFDNVRWEIDMLTRHAPGRCVFICERSRADAVTGQLRELLGDRTVLTYPTDPRPRDQRRFVRALRSALEAAVRLPATASSNLSAVSRERLNILVGSARAAELMSTMDVDTPETDSLTVAPSVSRLGTLAEGHASRRGRHTLDADDLWVGLLELDDPVVSAILDCLGARPAELLTVISDGASSEPEPEPTTPGSRSSAQTYAIVQLACAEALDLGQRLVRAEHLLLGLLRDGWLVATEIDRRGVTVEAARECLVAIHRALGRRLHQVR